MGIFSFGFSFVVCEWRWELRFWVRESKQRGARPRQMREQVRFFASGRNERESVRLWENRNREGSQAEGFDCGFSVFSSSVRSSKKEKGELKRDEDSGIPERVACGLAREERTEGEPKRKEGVPSALWGEVRENPRGEQGWGFGCVRHREKNQEGAVLRLFPVARDEGDGGRLRDLELRREKREREPADFSCSKRGDRFSVSLGTSEPRGELFASLLQIRERAVRFSSA